MAELMTQQICPHSVIVATVDEVAQNLFGEQDRGAGGKDGAAGESTATQPIAGHHRLPLPAPAIGFSTSTGKKYLRAALMSGAAVRARPPARPPTQEHTPHQVPPTHHQECYFRLAEAFHTQSEPAFCGLGTLVMVLNALEVDPGRTWKQPWRWYDESMFACCVDLEVIKKDGIDWRPWCSLAREHGLSLKPSLAVNSSMTAFRETVARVTASDEHVLVVNYSRATVGQVE